MKINKGDYVCLKWTDGYPLSGTVVSAVNYGNNGQDDWYIELHTDRYGYIYWKQSIDGGYLISVNGIREG